MKRIEGQIVDIKGREIYSGAVIVENGHIVAVERCPISSSCYILPGFIDAHVHIESSMLTPQHFGRLAIRQGCVATVSDPHEIANVLGLAGIEFMLADSQHSPVHSYFTIPSCVPATPFDSAGAVISAADVETLAASGRFVALSEMMNVPGVLFKDAEVMAKLESARCHYLPIDGHAPLLMDDDLKTYAKQGISTDHECINTDEALGKIAAGMKILIREGSSAKNYEALRSLIATQPDMLMFCTDDSHPNDLIKAGHIRQLVVRSLQYGYDLFDVLKIACLNAVEHYGLDTGCLKVGDKADFILVEDLTQFEVAQVYRNGVAQLGDETLQAQVHPAAEGLNNFHHDAVSLDELRVAVQSTIPVVGIIKDELVTKELSYTPAQPIENLEGDLAKDIAKLVYINRYDNGRPQLAFCQGFGLKKGALASSISHDSHNIIAISQSDADLQLAINAIIEHQGGISLCVDGEVYVLPLPIAGIMSNHAGETVADLYEDLDARAKQLGCNASAPFMTLAFLSLVVIPELKIGEKGLFRYSSFDWVTSS